MACCIETSKKVFAIITGTALAGFGGHFLLPEEKSQISRLRLAVCRQCESSTWLKITDYAGWLKGDGIEVVKNIADLSVLPMLDKKDYQPRAKLFCRICKCWLPAKTYVKNEQCPLNKWSIENG